MAVGDDAGQAVSAPGHPGKGPPPPRLEPCRGPGGRRTRSADGAARTHPGGTLANGAAERHRVGEPAKPYGGSVAVPRFARRRADRPGAPTAFAWSGDVPTALVAARAAGDGGVDAGWVHTGSARC